MPGARSLPRSAASSRSRRCATAEQAGNAVGGGGGVAEIADQGRRILHLAAADLPRRQGKAAQPARQRAVDEGAPAHPGADAEMLAVLADAAQRRDAGDVDDMLV